jgi:hypothetical protein
MLGMNLGEYERRCRLMLRAEEAALNVCARRSERVLVCHDHSRASSEERLKHGCRFVPDARIYLEKTSVAGGAKGRFAESTGGLHRRIFIQHDDSNIYSARGTMNFFTGGVMIFDGCRGSQW